MTTTAPAPFSLRRIAVPAFGPALLFSIGEGAVLPVVALSVPRRRTRWRSSTALSPPGWIGSRS
jgi:hypothetical protein